MPSKTVSTHACAVCGKSFPLRALVAGELVRPEISELIRAAVPAWSPEQLICRPDLARYRSQYVHGLLESEKR